MNDRIKKELSKQEPSAFHQKMLTHCMGLLKPSRSYMQTFYELWEDRHNIYRSYRVEDKNDEQAQKEGRPQKQVIPMTYAKIQTFKSFGMAVITQRPRVFELDAQGVEEQDYKELAEKILDADLRTNPFNKILGQHFTDIAKFGVGIMKHCWEEEFVYVTVEEEAPTMTIFGVTVKTGKSKTVTKKIRKRAGNRLRCVSPFDFYPDTRYPLSDLHKGEFCADGSDMSKNDLLQKQEEGLCAGVDHIENFDRASTQISKKFLPRSRINFDDFNKTQGIVRVVDMQVKITPSQFNLEDGKPLGQENTPTIYVVWIANDNRIIRCEPMGYLHNQVTYEVGQFDEDQHDFINQSLSDVLDRLQETMDWFMNARVESVTRTIDNQLVVDPLGVDMSTIVNRSRVILLKKGASRTGVDRYVKQLAVQDVTARHMDDISQLTTIMQAVSGVNENAMGQYHTGRRSATEARVVAQGAASRLKNITESIWFSSLQPTGLKMLLNLRQGLTEEDVIRMGGREYLQKPEAVQLFLASTEELVTQSDFFMYDGTLQSEKAYMAQTLMELFNQIIQLGPSGMINLELSPKLLLEKVYELLGVGSLQAYSIQKDPQTLQNMVNLIVQQSVAQYAQQQQPAIGPGPDAGGGGPPTA
jgi:hypothetical protein